MSGIITAFLDRQQRSVLARIGAGQSARDVITANRWLRELCADTGCDATTGSEFLALLAGQVTKAIGPLQSPKDRAAASRTVFAHFSSAFGSDLQAKQTGRHMVYKLYDARGDLLYIGITDRGPVRLAEHYRHKPWFGDVMRVEFERYETRTDSEDRERILIRKHGPRYNIQHNQGRQVA